MRLLVLAEIKNLLGRSSRARCTLIAAIPDSAFKDALMAAGTLHSTCGCYRATLPEVNGAGVQAAATGQNITTGATGSRTGSLRGKSSGEALKETGVWMQTFIQRCESRHA